MSHQMQIITALDYISKQETEILIARHLDARRYVEKEYEQSMRGLAKRFSWMADGKLNRKLLDALAEELCDLSPYAFIDGIKDQIYYTLPSTGIFCEKPDNNLPKVLIGNVILHLNDEGDILLGHLGPLSPYGLNATTVANIPSKKIRKAFVEGWTNITQPAVRNSTQNPAHIKRTKKTGTVTPRRNHSMRHFGR